MSIDWEQLNHPPMTIESMLRKALMWKSRIKWIAIGFMIGFIFGSFTWGANAHAEGYQCTGTGTDNLCSGFSTEEDCDTGDYGFCEWVESACVLREGLTCSDLSTTACLGYSGGPILSGCLIEYVGVSSSSSVEIDLEQTNRSMFGLNVGLSVICLLGTIFLFIHLLKPKS